MLDSRERVGGSRFQLHHWMNVGTHTTESLLGILHHHPSRISAGLEAIQTSQTVWYSYSTISPSTLPGMNTGRDRAGGLPVCILQPHSTGIPPNTSPGRDDLAVWIQLTRFNQHLLTPVMCQELRWRLRMIKETRKWPHPQGGHNPEGEKDMSNFKARLPERVPLWKRDKGQGTAGR